MKTRGQVFFKIEKVNHRRNLANARFLFDFIYFIFTKCTLQHLSSLDIEDKKITKILTIEAKGIGIACIAAQYFKVPVVFAQKVETKNLVNEVYENKVFTYTKDKEYTIRVSKRYLSEDDHILIIDELPTSYTSIYLKSIHLSTLKPKV